MTSLCRHLSAQEINWVETADGCVHTADTTQHDSFVASASASAGCIGHKGIERSGYLLQLVTTDHHRFTISEVAADWHELMIYCPC